jgi:hypothetical protein
MSSTKHTLRLVGAFAVLAIFALAASCRGFFVNPTLTAINIAPSAPQVELNNTASLSVYGTYNDGSTAQVKSGVSWSSSTPSVASFTTPTSNVIQGLSLGTTTITANAQAVTATATATVYLGGVTAFTVDPTTATITGDSSVSFTFTATANGTQIDITTDNGGTLTLTPSTSDITCAASGNTEVCTGDASQTGTFSLTMTYPGTTLAPTATITGTP